MLVAVTFVTKSNLVFPLDTPDSAEARNVIWDLHFTVRLITHATMSGRNRLWVIYVGPNTPGFKDFPYPLYKYRLYGL